MKDTPLHEEQELHIDNKPEDSRYHRLFVLVSECNGYPTKETLDEIVKEVLANFTPKQYINHY